MSDDNKSSNRESKLADSDIVLDLNFVPQWARKAPDEGNYGRFKEGGSDRGGGRGGSRGRSGGGRYGGGGGGRSGGRSQDRRSAPPRRDDRSSNSSGRGGGGVDQQDRYRRPRQGGEDSGRGQSYTPDRQPRVERERVSRPEMRVRFLPEQQALSGLIRQVSTTHRAYPLLDLAGLLMSKPGCCFVKLEVDPAGDTFFYQCKKCRTVAFDRSEIEAHIISDHIGDYFDTEDVVGEAPTGNFVCVAKCGYSGTLLGPPNHHKYNETVKRIHAERFANMNFESYKDRIKMSHDPEDVERWKEEASKTVVYRLKGDGASDSKAVTQDGGGSGEVVLPPSHATDVTGENDCTVDEEVVLENDCTVESDSKGMSVSEAERHMRDEVVEKTIVRTRKAAISEAVAHEINDRAIKFALRDEWQQESRFPIKLSFALRAAFKHKHMYIFKAGKGKGVNFVTSVQPTPLDPEHAIESIHDVLSYLTENPGCTKKQMVEALRPDADLASDEVKKFLQPLQWLVERGHIIEFFNGTFSVPLMKSKK